MVLNTGDMVGPYQVEREIGQGGMATVYSAYHEKLDRHVAIKMMHRALLDDPDFVSRFEREAKIIAKLEHNNIVPVYDYSEHEGQPFLVMKQIDGRTLKQRLFKGALALEEIQRIMSQVASALDYAHLHGILHRDIKPSNIVLDQNDTAYLADFGLARITQTATTTMSADMMLGTPHYISPEQAQGETHLDSRTDLYSLGIVLYELVVGSVPFNADTPYAIVHDHIYRPVPSPREVNPDIPLAIENVLLRALAKHPDDRYPTAQAMMDDFNQAVIDSGLAGLDEDRRDSAVLSLAEIRKSYRPDTESGGGRVEARTQSGRKMKVESRVDMGQVDWGEWGRKGAQWISGMAEKIETAVDNKLSQRRELTEEEKIRKQIEKKIEARQGLFVHIAIYTFVNLMLWSLYGGSGFPWPAFPTFFWGIGIVSHIFDYYGKYGGGAHRREAAIQREIERERSRQERGSFRQRRRESRRKRHPADDYDEANDYDSAYEDYYDDAAEVIVTELPPGNVRINADGELTDSFIQETDDYEQRRGQQ